MELPGTLPSQWEREDERMLSTVLELLEERRERSRADA